MNHHQRMKLHNEIIEKARNRKTTSVKHVHISPNGRQYPITFSSCFDGQAEEMRDQFIQSMKDIETHGLEATMQKWHHEEAQERRKHGLKVQEGY